MREPVKKIENTPFAVIDGAKLEGADDGQGLPKGFRIKPDGVYRESETDGETRSERVERIARVPTYVRT